jgi:hypothetical protein
MFDKGTLKIISEQESGDLSRATLDKGLSAVGFDEDENFFYTTIDRVLFSNPVSTIKTVLEAHGFVANLENILSCLDSFVFSVHGKVAIKDKSGAEPYKVSDYLPCLRFELPKKHRVGDALQSFYDEIAKYEARSSDKSNMSWEPDLEVKKSKELRAELKLLKEKNEALEEEVNALSLQLNREQKSLTRASRALDSQQLLPENTRICRVEHIDFKKRLVKVKSQRKMFEVPTHMIDRVPEFQARCLIAFESDDHTPIAMFLLNNAELGDLEKRTARLLYVDGESFKARDSMRNEFQIKAMNPIESATIKSLRRGMQVIISIADGYVVRFSVLAASKTDDFTIRIQEQIIVNGIARNQLVDLAAIDQSESFRNKQR